MGSACFLSYHLLLYILANNQSFSSGETTELQGNLEKETRLVIKIQMLPWVKMSF